MELTPALEWASTRRNAVLITLRADGRAQSSDITYLIDEGVFVVSLTDSRAKTANMRRDDRVLMHVTEPGSWSYLSFDATVELSAVAAAPDDDVVEQLVSYYRTLVGEHDDWDDYRQAMVSEGRMLARVTPHSVVGQTH